MSCEGRENQTTCNRQPFASDQECDRGSVDIHQFSDLPFCDTIDPSVPDIPPEIADTPLSIPVPPACTCININYDLKAKYIKKREFETSGKFVASGDCCEGNYVSNLDLQIPCPIIGDDGTKRIKMSIGYGSGDNSASASYIVADRDSCAFEVKDVSFDLQIPCPIKDLEKKVKVGIKYGSGSSEKSFAVVEQDSISCGIRTTDANFDLQIPCPVKDLEKKVKVGVKYGDGAQSKSFAVVEKTDDCGIQTKDVNFDLQIPCPVKDLEKKVKVGIKYGSGSSEKSFAVVEQNSNSCGIRTTDANFDLQIPCPVKDVTKKVKVGVQYGDGAQSKSFAVVEKDEQDCGIRTADANFDLQIPCPVKDVTNKVRVGVGYGSGSSAQSFAVVTKDDNGCGISTAAANFDLQIPCPVKDVTKKVKVGVKYGNGAQSKSFAVVEKTDDCGIQTKDVNFDLNIPCPFGYSRTGEVEAFATQIYAQYGFDGEDVQKFNFLKWNTDTCQLEAEPTELDFSIYCPLTGETSVYIAKGYKAVDGIHARWDWKDVFLYQFFKRDAKKACRFSINQEPIDLSVPCPIKNLDKKVRVGIKYGNGAQSKSFAVVERTASCGIRTTDVNFDLNIPCPFGYSHTGEVDDFLDGVYARYGFDGEDVTKFQFIKRNPNTCQLEVEPTELNFSIYCPLTGETSVYIAKGYKATDGVHAKWDWKDVFLYQFFERDAKAACKFSINQNPIDLSIPCPIKDLDKKVRVGVKYGDGAQSKSFAVVERTASCGIRATAANFDLQIPCPELKTAKKEGDEFDLSVASDEGACGKKLTLTYPKIDTGIAVVAGSAKLTAIKNIEFKSAGCSIQVSVVQDGDTAVVTIGNYYS